MTRQTLSHYEVIEKVGAGGMGVVYKAKDLNLDRVVALKFLAAHLTESPTAHLRFLREARAISALNHPNIATIYEVGESDGDPFLAFEFLPGGTLRSRLNELKVSGRKMPIADVIAIATEIADGLAHAHRNGILHRDIKPGNLMFSAEGKLKIMDFGLSKLLRGPDITQGEARLGTVLYMSPEQARGKPADQRSDIFSYGVVLYEMLAGASPFLGEDEPSTLKQVLHASPKPIERLRPDVPERLRNVVNRALEKDPRKRYERMEEVAADLRAIPSGLEYPTATVALTRPSRTRPTLRSWILFAVAILSLLGAIWIGRRWISRESVPAQKQIVVLPFENVGKDPANQAFCDGLLQTLTSMLTQMQQFQQTLLVIPASEVRRQAVNSPSDARKAFNANLVVTGSVERTREQVRVIANLTDTRNPPHQLGSRLMVRGGNNLASLQDELMDSIADLVQVELQPKHRSLLAAGKTSVGSAYDAYVQARGYLERYDRPGNLDQGLGLMHQAVELDPKFALAYAGLGWAHWLKFLSTKDPKALEQAQELALHAISIDTHVALAHVTLGLTYNNTGRYQEATRSYQAALDLDPISVEACRGLAEVYQAQGKLKEAEQVYLRAIELRPNDWFSQMMLGIFYTRYGNYGKAEIAFRKAVEATPDNSIAYRNLGSVHYSMGRYAEATEEYRKSLDLKPTANGYMGLAAVYFNQGKYREAASTNEKAVQLSSGNNYILLGNLAQSYGQVPELASKAPDIYRKAITIATQYIATNPADAHALSSRALFHAKLFHSQLDESTQALQDADRSRALAPHDMPVLYYWAVVQELTHHRDRALRGIADALRGGYSAQDILRDPELSELRRDPRFGPVIAPFVSTPPK